MRLHPDEKSEIAAVEDRYKHSEWYALVGFALAIWIASGPAWSYIFPWFIAHLTVLNRKNAVERLRMEMRLRHIKSDMERMLRYDKDKHYSNGLGGRNHESS